MKILQSPKQNIQRGQKIQAKWACFINYMITSKNIYLYDVNTMKFMYLNCGLKQIFNPD